MTAMLFITGEIEVQGKPAWMTVDLPAGGWVIYNMCLNIGALGIIYYGVAISQILTGENLKNLSRCRFLLGLTLFVMTPLDLLYQTSEKLFFYRLYGLAFLPVGLGYTGRIIYVYHTRAKYAKPSTKWRMHFAKWGCIFCLLSPMELIVPFKTLAIRPSLLLVIMAWTLFILSGVTPSWLKRRIIAASLAPQLFNDARFIWQRIIERFNPILPAETRLPHLDSNRLLEKQWVGTNSIKGRGVFGVAGGLRLLDESLFLLGCVMDAYNQIFNAFGGRLEKWVNQWAKHLNLSEAQTFSLIRAAYLEVGVFGVQTASEIRLSEVPSVTISEDVLMMEDSAEYEREILWWQKVAAMLRQTEERWDGRGSGDGLAGEEIPLESRLLKVISGFVAKWQATEDTEAAIIHIRAGAGTEFDPQLVDVLENLVNESWRL